MSTSASVIITTRDPGRLHRAGLAPGTSVAAFDATGLERLARFFAELPSPINHLWSRNRPSPHAVRRIRCRDSTPRRPYAPAVATADCPQHGGQAPPGPTLLLLGETSGADSGRRPRAYRGRRRRCPPRIGASHSRSRPSA